MTGDLGRLEKDDNLIFNRQTIDSMEQMDISDIKRKILEGNPRKLLRLPI